ncbi:MAG: uncharacterized protein JWQ53_1241 [Klenkia sp.]|nr:uncharacterized protein [Klenkia sp.]
MFSSDRGGSAAVGPGTTVTDETPPGPAPVATALQLGVVVPMVFWPAVALLGFLLLTALVIALGSRSTARYEQERRATAAARTSPEAAPLAA